MRYLGIVLLLSAATTLASEQDKKLPVPSPADQKKAEAELRPVFKEDYADRSREGRRALALKLLAQGQDLKNPPLSRYVILVLARDAAAEGLDVPALFDAVDELDRSFELGPVQGAGNWTSPANAHKAVALAAARKAAVTPEDQSLVAAGAVALAEAAVGAGVLEDAQAAADLAKASKDPIVAARAAELAKEIPLLRQELEAYKKAEATLATNVDDADANAVKGRYLLFVRRKTEDGLVCLAHGSDPVLKELAIKERLKPASPEAQQDLGEAWAVASDKAKDTIQKRRYAERAILWLSQAQKEATGFLKVKVEKRLADLEKLPEPSTAGLVGRWLFNEGSGTTTADSSGKGNTGTLQGGATWVPGLSGSAVHFDGGNGLVALGVAGIPAFNGPMTLAWSHSAAGAPSSTQVILALSDAPSKAALSPGYLDGKVAVWKWAQVPLVSTPPPSTSGWHSYAYTFDGKSHKLYVDGVLKDTTTTPAHTGTPKKLELGGWGGGGGTQPGTWFSGLVDEVRIYTRALPEPEIRMLVRKPR